MATRRWGWMVAVAAVGLVMGCDKAGAPGAAPGGAPGAAPGGGQMPPPEVAVVTVTASRVPLSSDLPGRTTTFLTAEVRPQVGGLVLKQLFEEGADVTAGQLLYQIDPASYEVALAQAKATLMRAEAALRTVSKRSQRYDALVESEAVSAQDRDDVSGGVRTSRADVAAARAAVAAAELNLQRTEVRAPVSGRVMRGAMKTGTLVSPFQSLMATIQQLDPVYVDIVRPSIEFLRLRNALESGKIARVSEGDAAARVTLILEDGTTYGEPGRLEFADATVDPKTGSVTLRAVFPNSKGVLLPGMYVRAHLDEGAIENALLVPQRGVSHDVRGQATALIVTGEGVVEQRVLTAERTVGDQWLVTSGVAVGDKVIVEGLQRARPGAPVRAVPFVAGKDAEGGKAAKSGVPMDGQR